MLTKEVFFTAKNTVRHENVFSAKHKEYFNMHIPTKVNKKVMVSIVKPDVFDKDNVTVAFKFVIL
jgi:hypothetical protein